jgi:hypothetical protein
MSCERHVPANIELSSRAESDIRQQFIGTELYLLAVCAADCSNDLLGRPVCAKIKPATDNAYDFYNADGEGLLPNKFLNRYFE